MTSGKNTVAGLSGRRSSYLRKRKDESRSGKAGYGR
jgi:hypothetical protein